ncbi:flagellar hook length control protein FliK [Kosakonia sp. WA-90]|uniref:flagellar hook length control protein FliK n=1 Tax=Kosakonia sp. WA-90 TaxID=3153576 RepID=UPI00325F85C7
MITLQKLLVTESDATTGTQTGKAGGDAAQDFLALLTGAMSGAGAQGQEGDAPLTLADLQAAALSGKLAKGKLAAASGEAAQTPAQKLADMLARQSVKMDAKTAAESNADMQNLLSGLTPSAQTDVLAALTKTAKAADEKTDLSDEDLANLSALMAMLPHQQTQQMTATQPLTTTSTATSAIDVGAAANRALNTNPLTTDTGADLPRTTTKGTHDATASTLQVADDSQQSTTFAAALASRKETDNAVQQTTNTTASIAPVTTTTSAAQASTPVAAPVISAPLGSHEWQQNLSQHVTLFTRQGQQSAELRLHPEELGQVQISIKLEDNQAQLQMVSAHSHVRQALEAALPVLRTSLAESGIQLGQSNISSESFAGQQQHSSQQQQASRSGSGNLFGSDDDEALVTPASLQSAARGNGAVDIFA